MACNLVDIEKDCEPNVGGVRRMIVMVLNNMIITDDGEGNVLPGEYWAQDVGTVSALYYLKPQTASFTEGISREGDTGSVIYQPTITFNLNKLSLSIRDQLITMASNRMVIFIEDNNLNGWALGRKNGMFLTGDNSQTGKQFTDLNGYTLTFTGRESEPILAVDFESLIVS